MPVHLYGNQHEYVHMDVRTKSWRRFDPRGVREMYDKETRDKALAMLAEGLSTT